MRLVQSAVAIGFLLSSAVTLANPVADMREPAPRTLEEKAYVLEEMRLLVESIQTITGGLATGHMEDVIEAAAAQGQRRNAKDSAYPAAMRIKETPLWKQINNSTRQGFDELADAARDGAPKEKQLAILAETMQNCIACHQAYRLVDVPRL